MQTRFFSIGSLFGGTVLAVLAATTPALLIVLGIGSVIFYVLGLGLWFRSRRAPAPTAPVPVTTPVSEGVPLPLTVKTIRTICQRAERYAKKILAPDAHVQLSSLEYQPRIFATFPAWSKTAGRHAYVVIGASGEFHGGLMNGSYFSQPPSEPYWGEADLSAAKDAPEIVRLVDAVCSRVRPFAGVLAIHSMQTPNAWEFRDLQLGRWMVVRDVEGEREKICYAFDQNDELQTWTARVW
jgi:hypothetical protein